MSYSDENYERLKLPEDSIKDVEDRFRQLMRQAVNVGREYGQPCENYWGFTISDTSLILPEGNNNDIDVGIKLIDELTSNTTRPYLLSRLLKDEEGNEAGVEYYALYFSRSTSTLLGVQKIIELDADEICNEEERAINYTIARTIMNGSADLENGTFTQNFETLSDILAIMDKLTPHVTTYQDISDELQRRFGLS